MSSLKEIFNEAASCKQSLTSCGYIDKLTMYGKVYKTKEIKKKSKRNTTWFNAPDSRAVKTNNGKRFSWLITMIQPCHSSHHYLNCSHDFLDSSRHFSDSFHDFFEAVPTTFVDSSQEILDSSQVLDSSHVLF